MRADCMPTWIERLGLFLFPNDNAWDRRSKARWLVAGVLGGVLLALAVAFITITASGVRLGGGHSGWRHPVEVPAR